MTATTSRRALLMGGTGAALRVAAAAVVPTAAEAAEPTAAERGHPRFTTRVQVAPACTWRSPTSTAAGRARSCSSRAGRAHRGLRIPTRVVHATHDQIVPYDHGQAVAAAIRGAELVTFTTAGHGLYIDERDRFNAELLAFAAG